MSRNITYREVEDRIIRGRAMIRDGIYPTKVSTLPEVWVIPSEDRARAHSVAVLNGAYNCTCEDYRYHGGVLECKHICAVQTYKQTMFTRSQVNAARPAKNDNVIYIDGKRGQEIVIKLI